MQAKLGLPDEELGKWRWVWCHRGLCERLGPGDVVGARLARAVGTLNDTPYLGMEVSWAGRGVTLHYHSHTNIVHQCLRHSTHSLDSGCAFLRL